MEPSRSEQGFIAIVGLLSPIQCLPALGFLTQEPAMSPSCDTVTLRRYFSRAFLQRCPEEAAQGCWTPPHPLPPVSRMQILHKEVRNYSGGFCGAGLSEEILSVLKTEDAEGSGEKCIVR